MMLQASPARTARPEGRKLSARTFFATPAAQLTAEMERDFFTSLRTSNGTYKTTCRQRFAGTNPAIVQQLRSCRSRPVRVLDIGVSSGISTIELHDDLRAAGLDADVVATDILTDAFLVRAWPGCDVLVEENGFPLRFDLPGGSMKPWVVRGDYRNGFFVVRKSVNTVLAWRTRHILRDPGDARITRVKLVTPRLPGHAGIELCTDDMRRYNAAFAGRFDFVRAANVLNVGYFDPRVLASMVANVVRYLDGPGSCLFVARTHPDGSNHGTLFRLGDQRRFETVWKVGGGSEIEDIVLESKVPHG